MQEADDEMSDRPLPREGMSWSWELDAETLLTALAEPAPWNRPIRPAPAPEPASAPQPAPEPAQPIAPAAPASDAPDGSEAADVDPVEAEFAELLEAIDEGRSRKIPLAMAAGRVAESLPTGPDLAGWLATSPAAELEDGALAGMAASYRRLASWAQAGELAIVAQLASRSAAADKKIGVDEQGRPVRLPEEACAQVSLALTMSQTSASWWSDLAVTLNWRLPATGGALRGGQIDLSRARLIADATAALDEETARAVEARVLPTAGDKTTAQLRAALRRAVIAADPAGAERRREEAERRARVTLYPDDEGTASLAGYSLPSVRAAAAMARITALANAMKASGAGGGVDLLRAQVFLGLLLGTLPYIPPAEGGPPDSPPDEPPDGQPDEPAGGPSAGQPVRRRPGDVYADGPPASNGRCGPRPSGRPPDRGDAGGSGGGRPEAGRPPDPRGPPPRDRPEDRPPDQPGEGRPPDRRLRLIDGEDGRDGRDGEDPEVASRPPPGWPEVRSFVPPGPAAMANLCPAGGGLLDMRVPWPTLTGESGEPGQLSRIGPITREQARYLADVAAGDAAVQWRVIVTDPAGRAVAVSRVLRDVLDHGAGNSSRPASLVRRVTVTMASDQASAPEGTDLPLILQRTLRAAAKAAEKARLRAVTDADAGGCARGQASPSYQPPPRLREFVTARDVTCRFPTCRQPVWRCDLDHSVPFDKGGRTCSCNLGGLCRFHHLIKQHFGWQLVQPTPGTFAWVTPSGRTYYIEPDSHAA